MLHPRDCSSGMPPGQADPARRAGRTVGGCDSAADGDRVWLPRSGCGSSTPRRTCGPASGQTTRTSCSALLPASPFSRSVLPSSPICAVLDGVESSWPGWSSPGRRSPRSATSTHRRRPLLHFLWGGEFFILVAVGASGVAAAASAGPRWGIGVRSILGMTLLILLVGTLALGYWPHGSLVALAVESIAVIAAAPRDVAFVNGAAAEPEDAQGPRTSWPA